MKKFLLRLAVFLSVATLGCAVLFTAVVLLNRHAIQNCRLEDGIDSLIVGDSHTAWAIDDAGVAGLRNISLNAEGYKYTYAKLRHLLETNPGIRRVYLGFSYHNLSAYYDEYIVGATFRMFAERYLPVLSLADYAELVKNSPRTAPDLFKRIVLRGLPAGLKGRCLLYGRFSPEPMTEEFRFASMEKRIAEQYQSHGRLYGQSALNREYLEKIIRLLREHDIELVTLNTPLHPEYEKRVPAQYREWYAEVLEANGIPSFDFRDLKLTDADFLPDGDHTNHGGAMVASRAFAEYHRAHPVRHGR